MTPYDSTPALPAEFPANQRRLGTVRDIATLTAHGYTVPEKAATLDEVASRFAVAITPAMLDLIDPADPHDPIARQFVPATEELVDAPTDVTDPIGDAAHSPLPGIVHRYPDRLLLTPIRVCPVYCRFCFRRETVGHAGDGALSADELQAALSYIRARSEVWEVILSGGDPLLLSHRRLDEILTELDAIEHVRVIRIHTRVPVVAPERINKKLIEILQRNKAVYVVLHSNHARELSATARAACCLLVDGGIPMLSQTVLLKGINDDAVTLEQLFRTLVENRIKPYYLHHADRAPGTAHFRTSVASGQALMRELRGRVSGLCQPEYVLDIPGGAGKVPIGPEWIAANSAEHYTVQDYQGSRHVYADDDL
jgi:lysine 2,3-aminomutase